MTKKVSLPTAVFGYHQNCGNWFKAVVRKPIKVDDKNVNHVWGINILMKPGCQVWVSKTEGSDKFIVCSTDFIVSISKEAAKTMLSSVLKNGEYILLEGPAGPYVWETYYWESTR